MKDKAKSLLEKISSTDLKKYARERALNKLAENPDISSIGYDSKIDPRINTKAKKNIGKIMRGTEEVGISPADEGGKWKELKVKPWTKDEIPNELSLYKLSGNSPSEFKKYFRNAETGRTDSQAKREQSKIAMPSSAKTMIQKYLKTKNGEKK